MYRLWQPASQPEARSRAKLRGLMQARAARLAAELGLEEDPFLGQLRGVIARRQAQAVPEIDDAAAALNTSARMLTDIAFLLGFSEQSAFDRAFRRWTQRTPRDYRNASEA